MHHHAAMKRFVITALCALPLVLSAQVLNKPKIATTPWATGLNEPVSLANCGDTRLFVVEKDGLIRIISDSMTVVQRPFLDISGPVNSAGNEQGLLGLAFEANYLDSGYFYVYYISGGGNGNSRISRFRVSSDPDSADVASEQVVYEWPQPYGNHNGGNILFGPDGYLYIGFGDGGSANDPPQNGQDLTEPLGDMIRIDVSQHNDTFLIPPTNPWINHGDTLPEIWASGLRNPWRWSFDRLTGDLWIGDVGQYDWEEVDFWPAGDNSGPNFGWRCREGNVANPGVTQSNCLGAGAYDGPVSVHGHAAPTNWCSITGGFVYRGSRYPHLYGHYVFVDYCAGDFVTYGAGTTNDVDTLLLTNTGGYAAFGEDHEGELYVANQQNGQVRKLFDPCPMSEPLITNDGYTLTATDGNSYQWYLNGAVIPGATEASYVPEVGGDYQVRVNFSTLCNLISDTLIFIATGVDERTVSGLALFPQPAKDRVIIERAYANDVAGLSVFDAVGRMVFTATWTKGQRQMEVDVATFPVGSYVVRLESVGTGTPVSAPLIIAR
jgi:glucose/arabinose dehydrogenase